MIPSVSIILPTYNRKVFLPEAFAAIKAQTFSDWELIVVDDGSTDGTRDLVPTLETGCDHRVQYLFQENCGAYAARNAGLNHAVGKYIAFYDSDDLWLPHHLQDCVAALEANSDVDWLYSATRMVSLHSGAVLSENTFYDNGRMRPFLRLKSTQNRSGVRVLDSGEATLIALQDALYAGLQTSLIRSSLFEHRRLPAFSVGEDQVFTVIALKAGFRLAFLDDVHVNYRIHGQGVSAGNAGDELQSIRATKEIVRAFESLVDGVSLSAREHQVLRKRLSHECFWNLAYRMQRLGMHDESLPFFRKGIAYNPWDIRLWKTVMVTCLKRWL